MAQRGCAGAAGSERKRQATRSHDNLTSASSAECSAAGEEEEEEAGDTTRGSSSSEREAFLIS